MLCLPASSSPPNNGNRGRGKSSPSLPLPPPLLHTQRFKEWMATGRKAEDDKREIAKHKESSILPNEGVFVRRGSAVLFLWGLSCVMSGVYHMCRSQFFKGSSLIRVFPTFLSVMMKSSTAYRPFGFAEKKRKTQRMGRARAEPFTYFFCRQPTHNNRRRLRSRSLILWRLNTRTLSLLQTNAFVASLNLLLTHSRSFVRSLAFFLLLIPPSSMVRS